MGIRFFLRFNFPFFILIPSGLILRAVLIKSLIVIGITPSTFAFLVSIRTIFFAPKSCNSAESSIVIILSSSGIYCDKAFRNVVFPEPVPPEINMLYFAFTSSLSISETSFDTEPIAMSFSIL